jgi:hypothetical protein
LPEFFVLESLYNVYIALLGATPQLDTPMYVQAGFEVSEINKMSLIQEFTNFLKINEPSQNSRC